MNAEKFGLESLLCELGKLISLSELVFPIQRVIS